MSQRLTRLYTKVGELLGIIIPIRISLYVLRKDFPRTNPILGIYSRKGSGFLGYNLLAGADRDEQMSKALTFSRPK